MQGPTSIYGFLSCLFRSTVGRVHPPRIRSKAKSEEAAVLHLIAWRRVRGTRSGQSCHRAPAKRVHGPRRPRDDTLGARAARRSEEHTSELQSQSNLVCRLLLEKKN